MPSTLPPNPDMEWLRKRAKEHLALIRRDDPGAKLHQAQRVVANDHGFASWRAMKAEVDRVSVPGRAVRAALDGDAPALAALLDEHPRAIDARGGDWARPLLHLAAEHGHLVCVELLLERGFDVGLRDRFDSATALHWAAGDGHVEVIQRLLDAGADPDDRRDAHAVGPLGWATCLGTLHRPAAQVLVERGASVHVFAAIGLGSVDLIDAAIAADPGALRARMSRFEHRWTPLHLAVARDDAALVRHLLERGADASATDDTDTTPLGTTTRRTSPEVVEVLIAAGADPAEQEANAFHEIVPIFGVVDMAEALGYYEEQLGFTVAFEYGEPTDFACVTRSGMALYLCTWSAEGGGQTPPGAWASIWMSDVDRLHDEYVASGADVDPPTTFPWGAREMNVRDPAGNVIRMSTVVRDAP